jgi:hypothetical protein
MRLFLWRRKHSNPRTQNGTKKDSFLFATLLLHIYRKEIYLQLFVLDLPKHMNSFELNNFQRKYFGLTQVVDSWEKVALSDAVTVYFDKDKISKVLNYRFGHSEFGYFEYDTDIKTLNRQILLPQTKRGKEQKLTVPRLLKIKGCGIQFSGTFVGGGIHVYDNRRNLFFIKSYYEDGPINNYEDIRSWVNKYITESRADYFEWLANKLAQKRKIQTAKEGDIIAFNVGRYEYGFARILFPIFSSLNNWIHPRSLTVAPYAFVSDTLNIDLDKLIQKETLPSIYVFDNEVYYSEMPIIGHRDKTEKDKNIPLPTKNSTSITIFYTKTDILNFMKDNNLPSYQTY